MTIGSAMRRDDIRWTLTWLGGLAILWVWLAIFLNAPAFTLLRAAFANTILNGVLVVLFALGAGWGSALLVESLAPHPMPREVASFAINVLRSVPQIIGILLGYIALTIIIEHDVPLGTAGYGVFSALVIAGVLFLQVHDLILERIAYFRKSDFYDAMLCCGISERRIINFEILARNSAAHLVSSAITLFASAIFLKCSTDFIVSVGLSNEVSSSNFPPTLGSLLATMDSKQDILAIGSVLSDPGYFPALFVTHLQGIATAFIIVFTLFCLHRIGEAFVERHKL